MNAMENHLLAEVGPPRRIAFSDPRRNGGNRLYRWMKSSAAKGRACDTPCALQPTDFEFPKIRVPGSRKGQPGIKPAAL